MTYAPFLLKSYLRAKYDNKIEVKNKELYSLCGCENDDQKGSVRALKSKFIKEFDNEILSETLFGKNETKENSNNSIVLPNKAYKRSAHQIQGVSEYHILSLLKKYSELPLFMYSKLYERVDKDYITTGNKSYDDMKALGIDHDMAFKKLTYSFYDMFNELFDSINEGKLDQEIKEYMKDVLKSFGKTYCLERFSLPFEREKLEVVRYWTEEYAKEWLEKRLLENPKTCRKYNLDLEKQNEYDKDWAKDMVKEGTYDVDYSDVIGSLSDIISKTLDSIPKMLEFYEPLTNDALRVIPLIYLMFDHDHYNIFDERPNAYIKEDILKLYIEMKRNNIPLGYIPCCIDYQESIDNLYDINRQYDVRWFGMNEPERFLQYTEDPTKKTDPEEITLYESVLQR
ncbi:hypothetical protein LCGC14_0833660 [marine sediment metagenome]|uniref:Uncharacterized protein n=1 Tax=marine sediment metagenome TaxID=412755 RepID=A0A0F9PJW2_9ZZZZ|nr:MAG: hypothetical protein Lokiarch_35380 [Candidatus Lokiarchaeum sp. GC14_75]HEC36950.1 hypothetical protein [bacterium]